MKEKEVKQPMPSLLPSVDPFLAGATHYYQYDHAIGSTPWNHVDVFALGAAGSIAPVTHAEYLTQKSNDFLQISDGRPGPTRSQSG
jgi:hypothetical protein